MIQVPSQFLPLRPVQTQAVADIVDAWTRVPIVIWQAPTGAGKSVGAVAAAEAQRADRLVYTCSGIQLQNQFVRDFDAALLNGRSNYPPLLAVPGATCADCNRQGRGENAICTFCPSVAQCPYILAKTAALHAEMACLNITFLLTEANGPGGFSGMELGVLDEADMLEAEMMRVLEFRVGTRTADMLGMKLPKKGVHRSTMVEWLNEAKMAAARAAAGIRVDHDYPEVATRQMKDKKRLLRLAGRAKTMAEGYDEGWVRAYERDGDLVLKPVSVEQFGQDLLWQHADKWLVMSATIVAPDQFARELGLEDGDYEFVESPSSFPVENRPIVMCGIAAMTKQEMDTGDATDKMVAAVQAVVDRHEGENVLVHSHTYDLTRTMSERLRPADGRRVWRYSDSKGRDATVRDFIKRGGVLVAPSLTRGLDLPDDLCRVVIIIKAPFPYLGDPQVNKRLHRDAGGNIWYQIQVAREIVQMCGRAVRHENDWATTYILDGTFIRNVWSRHKGMFPSWFRESVVLTSARQVLAGDTPSAGQLRVEYADGR